MIIIQQNKIQDSRRFRLTKLISQDLPHSTITNQIAFDQRDLHLTPEFEHAMDHRCQALVSKLET